MDQSNNVHLRWNKHQATLVSEFDALLDSEKLTDCTISAEGRQLKAHRIILSVCSSYFEELLTENYEKHPIIILHDVKYDTVKALMDFMYRGEVNVPQEELSGVLKLFESLQIRGLSSSGYVDDVNVQKGSGSSALSVAAESLQSQPTSVPCFASGQNESEGKVQSFRGRSPTVPSQEKECVEVGSVPKSIRKNRKNVNISCSNQGADQDAFGDVTIPGCDSVRRLPSRQQELPTSSNPAGRSALSPVSHQSVCSQLQISSGECTFDLVVDKKKQFSTPETELTHQKVENSADQEETSLKIKSEVLDSRVEIVDLDDDSDDYSVSGDYRDNDNNSREDIEERARENEDLVSRENLQNLGVNSLHSVTHSDYLNNVTVNSSPCVSRYRYVCHNCGKSYQYRKGLQRHLKLYCGKEPQFQCPRCNKRCARSDELKVHMSTSRCQMREKYCAL